MMQRDQSFKEAVAGHRQRIRDKFVVSGDSAFADYELLELLLTYAIPRQDVKPVAKELLKRYGTVVNLVDAPISELQVFQGLGKNSAALIKLIRSFAVRYHGSAIREKVYLSNVEDFADYARIRIGEYKEEVVMVFYMNTQNMLIHDEILSIGTTDRVSIYPATIAKNALLKSARSVVLCHNHPGGSTIASSEDNTLTLEIKRALSAVGVFLLDHIIISHDDFYSYRETDEKCRTAIGRILDKME